MNRILAAFMAAFLCSCTPLHERWQPEPVEPKTKLACVDEVCKPMTRKEFDVWIRDQQMRGAL